MFKKILIIVLWGIAVFTNAGSKDILTITHYSTSLNKEKIFLVYIPPDAKPGERFPVLFVLHGAYGSYSDWVSRTNVEELADNYKMILVFPDGGEFGWYVDSPIEKESQYETYISKELVEKIDTFFPTMANRNGRGIMGLSMGGHGAFILAAKHPDVFGSASSMSGILKITNHPDKWQIAGRLGDFKNNKEAWTGNSVWEQAERFKNSNTALLFDCGTSDTATGAIVDGRELHERLTSLGIPHIWREMKGIHSWEYWGMHLEEHFNFHQALMTRSLPEKETEKMIYFKRLSDFFLENSQLPFEIKTSPTICLLGSSSIQLFPTELLAGYRVYNRGIKGDVLGIGTFGLSHRLEESLYDMHPDYVVIKNGRNDLGNRLRTGSPSIEQMIEHYEQIIHKIKDRLPSTKIYIISSPPTRDKYSNLSSSILSYNMQLKSLAQKNHVSFLDLYSKLVLNDGLIDPKFTTDGLHLTSDAYQIWIQMIWDNLKADSKQPVK